MSGTSADAPRPSAAEIERTRVARFGKLAVRESMRGHGMPQHLADLIWSRKLLPVIGLAGDASGSRNSVAPIQGAGAMMITYAVCPAGTGPGLHKHLRTYETFTVLTGRFELRWGDDGGEKIELDPLDTLSMPPGLYRAFRNISAEEGVMQVIITGRVDEGKDVIFPRSTAEAIGAASGTYLDYLRTKAALSFADD